VIRTHRTLRRASFLVAWALAACVGAGRARAADDAGLSDVVTQQASSFEIYSGSHRLGTENFRIYTVRDTVIMTSDVVLDGASPGSNLPLTKSAAFRQRKFDSYPVAFVAETKTRRDTTRLDRVVAQFADTVAMLTFDRADRGRVESVGLPPGRLYVLEPGIYLQVQVLLADFVTRGQDTRKQNVLIPSLAHVLEVNLKRDGPEDIVVRGQHLKTQKVEMSDGLTTFDAWLDADGKMWRLVAAGQPLRVERGRDQLAHAKGATGKAAPSKHTTRKRATR